MLMLLVVVVVWPNYVFRCMKLIRNMSANRLNIIVSSLMEFPFNYIELLKPLN